MSISASDRWLPIALSEDIGTETPRHIAFGRQEIVLFRNAKGCVQALEDRCPHRRVPLSLGKVINGELRCAYHGWTFNGESGACTQIPNLSESESVPARYKVSVFHVTEANGFIFLWQGTRKPTLNTPSPAFGTGASLPLFGHLTVPYSSMAYRMAMLDGPDTLLSIHNIGITDFYLGDPISQAQSYRIDRAAGWANKGKPPSKWDDDYPFIFRTIFNFNDNTFIHQLLCSKEQSVVEIFLGYYQGARGTTNIVWRGHVNANHKYAGKIGRAKTPISIFSKLDGMALAHLLTGPSAKIQEAG